MLEASSLLEISPIHTLLATSRILVWEMIFKPSQAVSSGAQV